MHDRRVPARRIPQRLRTRLPLALLFAAAATCAPLAAAPQGFAGTPAGKAPRVEIPWNRLYDLPELYAHFDRLAAAYPGLVEREVIGQSVQGRELRVYTLTNRETGPARTKPAMWIDGNVHGNEVQASETVLYTAWYLLENHGTNPRVTDLLDGAAFYLVPSVNPDGRAHWFGAANTASSSRSGVAPVDSDRDGVADEDPANDLDGDGHITTMRKYVPGRGTHRPDPDDPRVMERVPADGPRGDWVLLGQEGIDDDGDGRINEDGPGGYDMNRAWPSYWQPDHVQYGAGPYPLSWPETAAIARFVLDHPNIAAVQSFHNSGGMVLRGPGAEAFGEYPRADVAVYDELGAEGEKQLPFYRYMVIWRDLYTVFGGFVTWTYEGLGIISFTNELWSSRRMFPDDADSSRGWSARHEFDDLLLMGDGFVDWHPFEHPHYGPIEIGGWKKDVGRVPPSFLIEEELHRNAMFCLIHAEAMPRVVIEDVEVSELGDGVLVLDAVFRNENLIPTRTARASQEGIGRPDLFRIEGEDLSVLAGGWRSDPFDPTRIELAERDPARLVSEEGIAGRGTVRVRWFLRSASPLVTLSWSGEKARDVSLVVELR